MKKIISLALATMLLMLCGCEKQDDMLKEYSNNEAIAEIMENSAVPTTSSAPSSSKTNTTQPSSQEQSIEEDFIPEYETEVEEEIYLFPMETVPDVMGKTYVEASRILLNLGFTVERMDAFSEKYPQGTVCDQNITAEAYVVKGENIVLTVSKGVGKLVNVPDVIGKNLEQATALIEGVGLKVKKRLRCSDTVADSNVISQTQAGGSQLREDSYVEIFVSAGTANTVGNTPSNSNNGGYAASQGDWVYYNNIKYNNYLYRMRRDGSQKEMVSTSSATQLNIVGDWIYFTDDSQYSAGFYKMKLDGSDKTRLSQNRYRWVYVVGDTVYYSESSHGGSIYKMNTDGEGNTLTCPDSCAGAIVEGDWIYYINTQDYKAYKIRTDGSGKTKINDRFETHELAYEDGKLFGGYGSDFMSINTDGSLFLNRRYGSTAGIMFNASDGWIYKIEHVAEGSNIYVYICRVSTNMERREQLYKLNKYTAVNPFLIVIDNWIYFKNDGDNGLMYRIKADGSNLQKMY